MKKRIFIYIFIFLFSIFLNISFVMPEDDLDLISLDLKGMDIRDVMKILSQKSGLNIVIDNEVKGTVTLYIKDVDVMKALDIICSTNRLAYVEDGTLIRIMTDREYEKVYGMGFADKTKTEIVRLNYVNASEAAKVISTIKTNIGKVIADDASNTLILIDAPTNIEKMRDVIFQMDVPLVTEVFSLDYAKAESLKDKLEQVISKGIGSLKYDDRTNKLIVKDVPKKIEEIRNIIEALDEKTQQVIIDANIVQVTLSDKYSYGIDWTQVTKATDVKITGDTNLSTGLSNVTPSTLTIATTGSANYKAIISLLKTYGETNVLSRPRITVINNQEAKILVGSKEVYVTSEVTTASGGTYHTTDHVEFVDVGVRLSVVPTINKQGFVTLKIKPEVSSADATKTVQLKNPDGSTRTVVPYVTTSETETTVMVKDGNTIIIGGLMKDTIVDHNEKVPFLGEIPILGRLFSTTGKSKEKTELVIFLTPHIITGDKMTEEVKGYVDYWEEKMKLSEIERPKELRTREEKKQDKSDKLLEKEIEFQGKEKVVEKPKRKIETAEIAYEQYYLTIKGEIERMMEYEGVSGIKGDVELQFTLDKEGFLIRGPVVLNRLDAVLVRKVVNCVKKASPFPPFPKELKKEELDFHIVITYE